MSTFTRLPVVASAADAGGRRRVERSRVPKSQRGRMSQDRALTTSTPAAGESQPAAAAAAESPLRGGLSVLNRYRALLLDSTYRPVGVANWQRAICLDLMDKADVLEYYDESVRSVKWEYFLPAVLRVRRHRTNTTQFTGVTLNRNNIMLRDRYSCQYCGSSRELTIDHVVPQSKGGGNTWENLVACCTTCNGKKGDKSLEQLRWKLRHQPKEPSMHEMEFMMSALLGTGNHDSLPQEWQAYIVPFTRKKKKQQAAS